MKCAKVRCSWRAFEVSGSRRKIVWNEPALSKATIMAKRLARQPPRRQCRQSTVDSRRQWALIATLSRAKTSTRRGGSATPAEALTAKWRIPANLYTYIYLYIGRGPQTYMSQCASTCINGIPVSCPLRLLVWAHIFYALTFVCLFIFFVCVLTLLSVKQVMQQSQKITHITITKFTWRDLYVCVCLYMDIFAKIYICV